MIAEGFNQRCNVSDPVDYGYGDAAPDTAKYGYGDAEPDTNNYGYGDAEPDYGYGDDSPSTSNAANNSKSNSGGDVDYGYGDAAPTDYAGQDGEEPKRRPRRRNSVTRYSLVCQDQVKNEYDAHANVLDQFRAGNLQAPAGPDMVPLKNESSGGGGMLGRSSHGSDDGSLDASTRSDVHGDKCKKKKKGWGLRLSRNKSSDF
jgi:hypothetical protein